MGVTGNPPTLAISCGSRRGADKKDTLVNAESSGELVVNVVVEEIEEQMNITSADFPPEVNEFQEAGSTPVPSMKLRAARVAESQIHIECQLKQVIDVENESSPSGLIIPLGIAVAHMRRFTHTAKHDRSIEAPCDRSPLWKLIYSHKRFIRACSPDLSVSKNLRDSVFCQKI
ncbi:flavin reductase [Scytonema sp. PRP1]|uniref:flavin reductase n=1 Tax=Scytonema sp. PRP1 TaxID=3120513 RepID=UPI002FD197B1